jgi:putative FmdB family regulatory protein
MPKYEYACKSCGQRLEVVQSFADAPLTECDACGGPLRKVFTPPGIAFKGSGFYRTDNRKRRTEPKTEVKADAGAGGDGKADTKAEPAKTDSAPAAEAPKAAESKAAPPKAAEAKTA